MKKLSIILVIAIIAISSCQKKENGYTLYEVKKGKHRSFFGIPDRVDDSFTINFCINNDYNLEGVDQYDWSKIAGFYAGRPSSNSMRLAWRYNPETDLIEIGVYAYVDGKIVKSDKEFPVIGYCNVGDYNSALINITDDTWELTYEGETYVVNHNCDKNYHKCYFYFGGNKTAPKKLSCWVKYN